MIDLRRNGRRRPRKIVQPFALTVPLELSAAFTTREILFSCFVAHDIQYACILVNLHRILYLTELTVLDVVQSRVAREGGIVSGTTQPVGPVEVFYSYAHEDEKLRQELEKHLSSLQREGLITGWHDRRIVVGQEWQGEVDSHLEKADIILLLISADFIASDYCYDLEMQRAIERHGAGEARVIPILLRSVDWQHAPFGKLQALPTTGVPVTEWGNRDAAFTHITEEIRKAIESGYQTKAALRSAQAPRSIGRKGNTSTTSLTPVF